MGTAEKLNEQKQRPRNNCLTTCPDIAHTNLRVLCRPQELTKLNTSCTIQDCQLHRPGYRVSLSDTHTPPPREGLDIVSGNWKLPWRIWNFKSGDAPWFSFVKSKSYLNKSHRYLFNTCSWCFQLALFKSNSRNNSYSHRVTLRASTAGLLGSFLKCDKCIRNAGRRRVCLAIP